MRRQPGTNTVQIAQAGACALPTINEQLPAAGQLKIIYDRSSRSATRSTTSSSRCSSRSRSSSSSSSCSCARYPRRSSRASRSRCRSSARSRSCRRSTTRSTTFKLMALTLAVGFVVDDAIVMLENIVRHMERGEPVVEAVPRIEGDRVHDPVDDDLARRRVPPHPSMGGPSGRLFEEFAVTIGAAILVSGFVSLTHPAPLRALPEAARRRAARPPLPGHRAGLRCDAALLRSRPHLVARAPAHGPLFSVVVLVLMIPLAGGAEGIPPERGHRPLVINTEPAEGTSWDAMVRAHRNVAQIATSHPAVDHANSSVRAVVQRLRVHAAQGRRAASRRSGDPGPPPRPRRRAVVARRPRTRRPSRSRAAAGARSTR